MQTPLSFLYKNQRWTISVHLVCYNTPVNYFSIARTFRMITLIRSMLSSGRSRIWSHTCAMTASFALSTGCGSANSSASEMFERPHDFLQRFDGRAFQAALQMPEKSRVDFRL